MKSSELELLIKAHQAQVFRYLLYLGAGRSVAEDITQETFLTVFTHSDPVTADEPHAAAWLRSIARNIFLRHCRRDKNSPVRFDSDMLAHAEQFWKKEFLRSGDGFDYLEALRKCMEGLSERHRRIIESRYAEKVSRNEMANAFEMTENGIKSLLRRIRLGLADCVREKLGVEQTR